MKERFTFDQLEIKCADIATLLGYGNESSAEPFLEMIGAIIEEAPLYCVIKGGFHIFKDVEIIKEKNSIRVKDQYFITGKTITSFLKNSEEVALFVCSAGQGLSDWSKREMAKGNLTEGYIIDVLGSMVVERAMDILQSQLAEKMKGKGMRISNRYSPGYCGWDVSEQHKLFSLLPQGFCGVTLNKSALMSPIKSISGVLGIGGKVRFNSHSCSRCNDQMCPYRGKKGDG